MYRSYNLLSYQTIEKAVKGEPEAMLAIVQHYNRYMYALSEKDAETYGRMVSHLMLAILKFKLD